MAERGTFADHAASLVMMLMYGVRMSGPHRSTVAVRLPSQVTKWTCDFDRLLPRIYSYFAQAKNPTLKGPITTGDVNKVVLVARPDADLAGDFKSTKRTTGFFLEVTKLRGGPLPSSREARSRDAPPSTRQRPRPSASLRACAQSSCPHSSFCRSSSGNQTMRCSLTATRRRSAPSGMDIPPPCDTCRVFTAFPSAC